MKNILIVNDDGINAKGINVLEEAARILFREANIVVFAPTKGVSGAGRSLTFGGGKMVEVNEISRGHYAVNGSPCDCVEIACRITEGFDLCLSGVNHGLNLGNDLYLSGTAQAGHYAWDYFKVPAVAFSSERENLENGDETTQLLIRTLVMDTLQFIYSESLIESGFCNVNIPHHKNIGVHIERNAKLIKRTSLGEYRAIGKLEPKSAHSEEEGGEFFFRGTFNLLDAMTMIETSEDNPATDVGTIKEGLISVTKIE